MDRMMRGRGDGKYRRGSPGRWESNERGRPYAESPDSGRSVSRSRSPPPRLRPPVRAVKPGQPRRAARMSAPSGRYSSDSDSSGSRDGSPSRSSSSSEGRKAAVKKPPLPGAHKKEILAFKKKEKEIMSRLQAAEEELQSERASRESLQAKAEFLGDKVKTVAERSKNRGQMLVKLIQGIRQVAEAKNRLTDAENELENIVEAATSLMQNEEQSTRQHDPNPAKSEPPPTANTEPQPTPNNQRQQAQWTAPATAAAPVSQPQSTPPEPSEKGDEGGRWTEAAENDGNDAPGPRNMRSFKFNIKLPS